MHSLLTFLCLVSYLVVDFYVDKWNINRSIIPQYLQQGGRGKPGTSGWMGTSRNFPRFIPNLKIIWEINSSFFKKKRKAYIQLYNIIPFQGSLNSKAINYAIISYNMLVRMLKKKILPTIGCLRLCHKT